jgi:glutathione peroxidase
MLTSRTRIFTLLVIVAGAVFALGVSACGSRGEGIPVAKSVHGFTLNDITGKPHAFAQHQGKVLLIVNVASKCGYTGQYAGLQALYTRFKDRGLVVIGVPSNDFLWQEPGSDAEIAQFCSRTYGVTFPMMAKVEVSGDNRHPLYWYLTRDSARPGKIGWNFTKFLIGRDGTVVERFGASTAPDDPALIAALDQALQVQSDTSHDALTSPVPLP